MLDNKYDRFVKNRRTGKLDTRSLYKVSTSSKLFKKREARKNKDYAVSLVVDCSGSMGGDKISMAAESAEKLSHHLARIGIPHNVVGFHVEAREFKPFNAKEKPNLKNEIIGEVHGGENYAYYFWDQTRTIKGEKGGNLWPFVGARYGSKSRKELWNECKIKADAAGKNIYDMFWLTEGPSYNSDAEALAFARKLLLKQKGTKLMIFLSDGQPAPLPSQLESPIFRGHHQGELSVTTEVTHTLRSGIELYSVGIMDSSVNKYYPPRRTGTISSLKQLYPHIIKLIKINLKRG